MSKSSADDMGLDVKIESVILRKYSVEGELLEERAFDPEELVGDVGEQR